jgi:DNA-binding CsgD family transcriptional regulator
MKLLEREDLLAQLQEQLRRSVAGPGMLVFIEGEAGIGKTSLLRAFAANQRSVPVRWGGCDALQTPRPLGPLYDIAAHSRGPLQTALGADADRLGVYSAFLDEMTSESSLILMEDLHWADEATLDLLRFTGRRIARTRSLVVGTFRSDEVGPSHPLRLVLGDLATSGIQRIEPRPLSVNAVRELAGDRELDAGELHRRTGGNPFFVTEVLAASTAGVPATVRDAVLTRAARLRPSARAILDAAAVAGSRVEPWLLQDLAAAESASIDECLATGVLRVADGVFLFRHELARQAILQALTPTRLLSLHRMVLQILQSPATPSVDLARLAHHAEGAAFEEAVLEFAPAAGRDAAAKGAHRQAAEQFARAIRFATRAPAMTRASLLDEFAAESHLKGSLDESIDARLAAITLWQEIGDPGRQAISLCRMSHALVAMGRNGPGEAAMNEALAIAARLPGSQAALTVHRWSAFIRMLDRDIEQAIDQGQTALALAEKLADQDAAAHCLNTIGSSMIVVGRVDEGRMYLERGLGMRGQSDASIASALGNLGSGCGEARSFFLAEDYLRRGIDFSIEHDLDMARLYQMSWLALVHLYRGRWDEASRVAHAVLSDRASAAIARMMALITLGRVRARRGDPGIWEALDAARTLAGNTGTLQRVAPMQAARAEAAWLEGRTQDAANEASAGVELAVRKRHPWFAAELLYWIPGFTDGGSFPDFCADRPFALEARGIWREAADTWTALGCPYEAACSLATGDEAAQREALATFESLGARPMIERVRHRLRAAGVRGLPRGPRESTKQHPAGLTSKEVAVLSLLAQGLRNREIAQRLSRSARTIDHHLAAIFAKLEVTTRAEAVSVAHRLGVVSHEPRATSGER